MLAVIVGSGILPGLGIADAVQVLHYGWSQVGTDIDLAQDVGLRHRIEGDDSAAELLGEALGRRLIA